jgi:beta-phosphoglucomutase-like phosphatase (HAD superfamily)
MTGIAPVVTLSPRDYDAVLFDLDGVLTKTASVHAAAWKRLFDGFLEQRAAGIGEPFVPFDIDAHYRRYVDGKPRYDGVAAFLESRGIELPVSAHADGPADEPREPLPAELGRVERLRPGRLRLAAEPSLQPHGNGRRPRLLECAGDP